MRDKTEICKNCLYFVETGRSLKTNTPSGNCQINPPVADPDNGAYAVWPKVKGDYWCGGFEDA